MGGSVLLLVFREPTLGILQDDEVRLFGINELVNFLAVIFTDVVRHHGELDSTFIARPLEHVIHEHEQYQNRDDRVDHDKTGVDEQAERRQYEKWKQPDVLRQIHENRRKMMVFRIILDHVKDEGDAQDIGDRDQGQRDPAPAQELPKERFLVLHPGRRGRTTARWRSEGWLIAGGELDTHETWLELVR